MGSDEIGKQEPGLFRVEGKWEAVPRWTEVLLPQCFVEAATLYDFDYSAPWHTALCWRTNPCDKSPKGEPPSLLEMKSWIDLPHIA